MTTCCPKPGRNSETLKKAKKNKIKNWTGHNNADQPNADSPLLFVLLALPHSLYALSLPTIIPLKLKNLTAASTEREVRLPTSPFQGVGWPNAPAAAAAFDAKTRSSSSSADDATVGASSSSAEAPLQAANVVAGHVP